MDAIDNASPGLSHAWYAVALAHEIGDEPVQVRVLGEPWVLARIAGEVRAFVDRCPHRLAPLSIGSVVGDRLQCRYHGWEFTAGGDVARIPALGDDATLPSKACLTPPAGLQERYGLIWLAPSTPVCDLPAFPEWEAEGFDRSWNAPRRTTAGAAQLCDNFLDASHLGTVHVGTFGVPEAGYLPPSTADRDGWVASTTYRVTYKNHDDPLVAIGEHPLEQPQDLYKEGRPATTALVRLGFPLTGKTFAILFSCLPATATETVVFKMMARDDLDGDETKLKAAIDFEDRVLDEDLAVLESYDTQRLPLDLTTEIHVRSDRLSTTYRRILADMVTTSG